MPATLRSLAKRIDSPAVRLCLDLGHANVVADLRHTRVAELVEPALDATCLFHLHDNLGARRRAADQRAELDPLKLDLHLAPGRGSLDWSAISPGVLAHEAPLMLEVHPPHRPAPAGLFRLGLATLMRGVETAGEHRVSWHAGQGGAPVGNGVYFIRLEAGEAQRTIKAVLAR